MYYGNKNRVAEPDLDLSKKIVSFGIGRLCIAKFKFSTELSIFSLFEKKLLVQCRTRTIFHNLIQMRARFRHSGIG
jgi:hypothetical protein